MDPLDVVSGRRRWVVAEGDNLPTLAALPDNCLDACVTDPPYGLSEDPDIREVLRKWMLTEARYQQGGQLRKGPEHCACTVLARALEVDSKAGPGQVQPYRDLAFLGFDEFLASFGPSLEPVMRISYRAGYTGCEGICGCHVSLGNGCYRLRVRMPDAEVAHHIAQHWDGRMHVDIDTKAGTVTIVDAGPKEWQADTGLVLEGISFEHPLSLDAGERTGLIVRAHPTLLWRLSSPTVAGAGFMNREWDAFVPGPELWKQVYRVLKPGAHLLAFCSVRTWDLMSIAIRFAGFENRDTIACYGTPALCWTYATGFPKGVDISKAIDKAHVRDTRTGELVFHGNIEDVYKITRFIKEWRDRSGVTNSQIDALFGLTGMANHWTSGASQPQVPSVEQWAKIKELLGADDSMDSEVSRINRRKGQPGEGWLEREVTGQHETAAAAQQWIRKYEDERDHVDAPTAKEKREKPKTELAAQWEGWNTALKPSWEVILVFRKPLVERSIVEQVLATGTGAIHIDACRVAGTNPSIARREQAARAGEVPGTSSPSGWHKSDNLEAYTADKPGEQLGRWPPNITLAHAPGCKLRGSHQVKIGDGWTSETTQKTENRSMAGANYPRPAKPVAYAPEGIETIEDWDCVPGCPIDELNQQSGISTSTDRPRVNVAPTRYGFGSGKPEGQISHGYADEGGAARFFPQFDFKPGELEEEITARVAAGATPLPEALWRSGEFQNVFRYTAKVSLRERNEGLPPGLENRHPTVKPVALLRWLVRLITPKGGIVLDPFVGSGSTGMAALWEHARFIGCELEAPSAEIARRRCQFASLKPRR